MPTPDTEQWVEILGSPVRVRGDREQLSRFRTQWSRCLIDPPAEVAAQEADYPRSSSVPEIGPDAMDYQLTSRLTLAGIERLAGKFLLLHAAGIAHPVSGRAAALIAASGTGKTTASTTLCADEFGYLTDETVAIGQDRSVLPYPKPLSIVTDPEQPHTKHQLSPDQLGLLPAPADPLLSRLVVLRRESGATPALSPMPLLDGMMQIIPHTSALPQVTDPLFTLASLALQLGGIFELSYAEVRDTGALLHQLLDEPGTPSMEVLEHLPPNPDHQHDHEHEHDFELEPERGAGWWQRADYADAIGWSDELLVLRGDTPIKVGGVGALIWRAAIRPVSTQALLTSAIEELGDHPQAAELVTDALAQLTRIELLTELG